MKLLVDNDLPYRMAEALQIVEPDHTIVSLRAKFGREDLKDEEWITALGKEGGWATLSADIRIAKKRPSRDLFLSAGLIGFFYSRSAQKLPLRLKLARILILWPQILTQVNTNANGVFEIPSKGHKFSTIGR